MEKRKFLIRNRGILFFIVVVFLVNINCYSNFLKLEEQSSLIFSSSDPSWTKSIELCDYMKRFVFPEELISYDIEFPGTFPTRHLKLIKGDQPLNYQLGEVSTDKRGNLKHARIYFRTGLDKGQSHTFVLSYDPEYSADFEDLATLASVDAAGRTAILHTNYQQVQVPIIFSVYRIEEWNTSLRYIWNSGNAVENLYFYQADGEKYMQAGLAGTQRHWAISIIRENDENPITIESQDGSSRFYWKANRDLKGFDMSKWTQKGAFIGRSAYAGKDFQAIFEGSYLQSGDFSIELTDKGYGASSAINPDGSIQGRISGNGAGEVVITLPRKLKNRNLSVYFNEKEIKHRVDGRKIIFKCETSVKDGYYSTYNILTTGGIPTAKPNHPSLNISNPVDTLILKTGECKPLLAEGENSNSFIWTTGNQDISNIESVFGSVKICGISEGLTYVSGSSINGENPFKIIVKVLPDPSKKIVSEPLSNFNSSIDDDVEETLKKIMTGKSGGEYKSKLKVSDNKRYLVEESSGKPFLFLSQTLWSMTRQLSREEVVKVLDICKDQGFTAIQLLAHSHYMGSNVYGNVPFENENFLRPDLSVGNNEHITDEYDWWDHLEFIIQECIKRELYVCLLPTWREQWNQKQNLHQNNSFAYGKFIGQRYRAYNPWLIWVMGGDEAPNTSAKINIHRELARGVVTGICGKEDYSQVIMTYHTHGPTTTSDFFKENEPFLDFNTIQSGHSPKNLEGMIEKAYNAQVKPVMDFEPSYTKNGQNTNETRTIIYWGVFSGGFGTSYGSWNLWHCGERNDLAPFKIPNAFYEGFGTQIRYLGKLLTSYSMLVREPNQKMLLNNTTSGLDRILACTATDQSYAMVYTPKGEPFTVDLSLIDSKKIYWHWFNPRNGEILDRGSFRKRNLSFRFIPPTRGERFSGNDWVLVLDSKKSL